jgi:hypothetical protein
MSEPLAHLGRHTEILAQMRILTAAADAVGATVSPSLANWPRAC